MRLTTSATNYEAENPYSDLRVNTHMKTIRYLRYNTLDQYEERPPTPKAEQMQKVN